MQQIENVLSFFIPSAHAAATTAAVPAAAQPGGGIPMMLMLAVLLALMYFTMLRPQSKRAKEHRNLILSLAKGDEVLTAGGIVGRVVKLTDNYIVVAVQKSSIVSALPKGTLKSI